jgi:putative cell wall-binding protein
MRRTFAISAAVALVTGISTLASVAAGSAQAASAAPIWSTANPQHSPPIDSSAVAFDGATGQLVLFGTSFNAAGCPPDITRTWDGGNWADHQQVNAPDDRVSPTMGYDAATKQVVMFGGTAQGCGAPPGQGGSLAAIADTWTWNGSIWVQQHPATVPQSEEGGCAAYDTQTQQYIMYGGYAPGGNGPGDPDAESWQWTGTNWTRLTPAATPPAGWCEMTYDPVRKVIVMLVTEAFTAASAADNGANDVLETWLWNGTDWDRAADLPTSSSVEALSFDPDTSGDVTYIQQVTPCSAATCPETDATWSFDGSTWTQTSTNTPQAGRIVGAVYDAATQQFVMFGGLPRNGVPQHPVTWLYASPGSSSATPSRLSGATRQATAVAVSTSAFPAAGSASAIVLARADDFADALAGGPLAAAKHAPLLLTSSGSLDAVTGAEIQRVLPKGGTVYLLGGTSAISDAVAAAITALGDVPTRIAGTDRYGTAIAIASAMGNPTTVFEASGINFPDALSAVPAAVANHGAILLTDGSAPAAVTSAYLAAHATTRYAIGGPAAYADPSAIGIAGADRYATSNAVALAFFPDTAGVSVASAANFPDALAAGPVAGEADEPVLLVPPTGALPEPVTSYVTTHAGTITSVQAFGGTSAIASVVLNELAATLSE